MLEGIRQNTPQHAAPMQARVQARVQADKPNQPLKTLATPSQLLADMAEEISFSHSEKIEEKEIEDHACEDYLDKSHARLVEEVAKEYPPDDPEHQAKHESFMKKLAQQPQASEEEIRQLLGESTSDAAQALALLTQAIGSPDLPGGAAMKEKLEGVSKSMVEMQGEQIQAGINTIALARRTAKETGMSTEHLQANYQKMVGSYEAILPALSQLANSEGIEAFEAGAGFVNRAAARDLAAARPSVAPARLQRILAEFQGVKVFNTLREWVDGSLQRFAAIIPKSKDFSRRGFFTRVLSFLVGPEKFRPLIAEPMAGLNAQDKVLLLQDLRQAIRTLPNWLFASGGQEKERILYPVQKEIDHLVFEENA